MLLRLQITALVLAIFAGAPLWAAGSNSADIKADSLHQLQELRTQNVKRLAEIDAALGKRIEAPQTQDLESDVEILKAEKHEHMLRQEFLDRLIFEIDTKFTGGDLRAFLEHTLLDMAKVDAAQASSEDSLWRFLKYTSEAIHRLPEQKENILAFIEGYMNRSVSNPMPPQDYLNTRNYTNGAKSESGRPMSREEVGEFADQRIHEMSAAQAVATPPAPAVPVQHQ